MVLLNFSSFILRLKVFRSITNKYLYDSNIEYSDMMQLFKGPNYSMVAASGGGGGVLDITLGGEVRRGPTNPDHV